VHYLLQNFFSSLLKKIELLVSTESSVSTLRAFKHTRNGTSPSLNAVIFTFIRPGKVFSQVVCSLHKMVEFAHMKLLLNKGLSYNENNLFLT
jgi:hypothetical protein